MKDVSIQEFDHHYAHLLVLLACDPRNELQPLLVFQFLTGNSLTKTLIGGAQPET